MELGSGVPVRSAVILTAHILWAVIYVRCAVRTLCGRHRNERFKMGASGEHEGGQRELHGCCDGGDVPHGSDGHGASGLFQERAGADTQADKEC